MKKVILFALFAILAIHAFEEEDNVLILTDSNFDEALVRYEFILVKFYAPWCGHCKKLAPEYAKAAKALKNADPAVALAKVDATQNQEIAQRFSIQGYPTLKFFTAGNDIEYNGGRTENEIISWLKKRTGTVTTDYKNAEELQAAIDKEYVFAVYFGTSVEDKEYGVFKSVAMGYEKVPFATYFVEGDFEKFGATKGQIVMFKQFDEKRNTFSGDLTAADLKTFVEKYSFANVMPFDDRAIEKIFQKGNPTIFLFANDEPKSVVAEQIFQKAAADFKEKKILFCISKPNDGHGHFQRLAEYVGASTTIVPNIMLVHSSGEVSKYKFEKEITYDNIGAYLDSFNNNTLEKYLKSEEIPEKNDEPVKIIVGKQFNQLVIDNEQDVLVKFYAPWCGHCKSLAPHWDSAAKALLHNKNIVIAKIDSTANEVPGTNIRGFPTLKFYPNGKKDAPIDFDGERTEEGIIKFLKEHTTHKWTEAGDKIEDL